MRANFLLAPGLNPHVTRGNLKTGILGALAATTKALGTVTELVSLSLVPSNQHPACISKSGEI